MTNAPNPYMKEDGMPRYVGIGLDGKPDTSWLPVGTPVNMPDKAAIAAARGALLDAWKNLDVAEDVPVVPPPEPVPTPTAIRDKDGFVWVRLSGSTIGILIDLL